MRRAIDGLVDGAIYAGAALIVVQMVWITYGVFARYLFNAPDGVVTEATELLLLPLAFVGMAGAFRDDSNPRVTMLLDRLTAAWRSRIDRVHDMLCLAVAVYLTVVACSVAVRTFQSGAQTPVLAWPEWVFWVPVAISALALDIVCLLRLAGLAGRRTAGVGIH